MHFERLTIKNFLALAEAEIDFAPGLHFIDGRNHDMGATESNGSGKTAIWEALEWACFGTIMRKAKADEVVNKATGQDCEVTLRLQTRGRQVEVERYRLRDGRQNGLRLVVDGQDRTAHLASETQAELEALLPVDRQLFRYAILVGQGMPFRFMDLSETEKQGLLCQLVDLDLYDKAAVGVTERSRTARQAVDVCQGVVTAQEHTVGRYRLGIQELEERLTDYQEQTRTWREAEQEKLLRVQDEIATYREPFDRAAAKLADLQEVRGSLEAAVRVQEAAVQAVGGPTRQLQGGQQVCGRQLYEVETRLVLRTEEAERQAGLLHAGTCPTCHQLLTAEGPAARHHEELVRQVGDLHRQVAQARAAREYMDRLVSEAVATEEETRQAALAAQQALQELDAQAARQQRIKDRNQQLIQEAEGRAQGFAVALSRVAQEEEKLRAAVGQQRVWLADGETTLAAARARLGEAERLAAHWGWWREAIPRLRAAAIEDVLGFLNQRISAYMEALCGGALRSALYQRAHGKTSRIKVDIQAPGGTYDLASGGERRRVDLALYLAQADLLRSRVQCNLLVCDEITDNLSPEGTRAFLDVLKQKTAEGRSIWVVSHDPAIRYTGDFDSTLLVEKRAGKAHVRRLDSAPQNAYR
jgi:DNA repair exonuclease SbcCD ATPase subunit